MLLAKQTADHIYQVIERKLKDNTPLTYFGEGSIVKAIVMGMSEVLEQFYDRLDFNTAMGFVSTAQGSFLDLLGELLDCKREPNESDENYRYRIVHQVHSIAGANETAIRLACLSVDNVAGVKLIPFTKGAGSFIVYATMADRSLSATTLQNVQQTINEVQGFGIKGEVVTPIYVPVDIRARLILPAGLSRAQANSIVSVARQSCADYIDNLGIGHPLLMAHLFHRIINSNNKITNVELEQLHINDRPVLIADRHAKWNQEFIPRYIDII